MDHVFLGSCKCAYYCTIEIMKERRVKLITPYGMK